MDTTSLIEKLTAYGADIRGIQDRFRGDTELYGKCYRAFLVEPNLALLEQAMTAQEHSQAFESAHALKGLSGNLGLTPLYDTLCRLVESLRRGDYRSLQTEYADVVCSFLRLADLAAEGSAAIIPAAVPAGMEAAGIPSDREG